MIVKSFELDKIDLKQKHLFLFYGENQGHKEELIKKLKKKFIDSVYSYDETEVVSNKESFFNSLLTKSFFEKKKLIIISRSSDKIKEIIEEIEEKKIEDLTIVLNSSILEKKSKLRTFFEKNKNTVCVAFYADNNQTLISLTNKFLREHKISISQESINLLVERSRGDRQNLKNELEKIQFYIKNKNKIEIKDLLELTNLAENYNVSELVDSCLAKNKKKTFNILNENNYSYEDSILIIRTFLAKAKRLLKFCKEQENKKNIEEIINTFKPPIFWKDKEIVKQQIKNWSYKNVINLICEINQTELLIKKNSASAINILSNFIIEKTKIINN